MHNNAHQTFFYKKNVFKWLNGVISSITRDAQFTSSSYIIRFLSHAFDVYYFHILFWYTIAFFPSFVLLTYYTYIIYPRTIVSRTHGNIYIIYSIRACHVRTNVAAFRWQILICFVLISLATKYIVCHTPGCSAQIRGYGFGGGILSLFDIMLNKWNNAMSLLINGGFASATPFCEIALWNGVCLNGSLYKLINWKFCFLIFQWCSNNSYVCYYCIIGSTINEAENLDTIRFVIEPNFVFLTQSNLT